MIDFARRMGQAEAILRQQRTRDREISKGTAFPSNPADDMFFFRTDLGLPCYYDGTRWLTVHEYQAQLFTNITVVANGNVTGPELRSDYAPYITRITIGSYITAPNNGTNYWTLQVRAYEATYTTATGIDQIDTSARAAGAWAQSDRAAASFTGTNPPTNRARYDTLFAVFGAPGAIICSGSIYWRLIIT